MDVATATAPTSATNNPASGSISSSKPPSGTSHSIRVDHRAPSKPAMPAVVTAALSSAVSA